MSSRDNAFIELRNLSVTIDSSTGSLSVLDGINLCIRKGERVGVIGPSGAGKTTLLRAIAGLITPTSGATFVEGEQVSTPGHRPNYFGMMFQEPGLLEWRTIYENITLPFELDVLKYVSRKDRRERADFFLQFTRLDKFRTFYPSQLSGGMKQRVSLIRSLITQPSALLLDEPFSALDDLTRRTLWQEFDEIMALKPLTAVFVTHSIEEAAYLCDSVIVLSNRPARLSDVFDIDVGRPRSLDLIEDDRFRQVVKQIRKKLYEQTL